MHSLIVLVLAVLATQAAVIEKTVVSNNLNAGFVNVGDRLLHRSNVNRTAIANEIQFQYMRYQGNFTTRITAVQAVEIGHSQWAYAFITAGGIGHSNVTVRFQSDRGRGYNYEFTVWGR